MDTKTSKPKLTPADFEFVSSVRSSVLLKSPKSTQQLLWVISILVLWLIVWANFAKIDEITRGDGKVIPSGQIQVVQNLEGGIVKELLVKVGDSVKSGQTLLKIDNSQFTSSFAESKGKVSELQAKTIRLEAESQDLPFVVTLKSISPYMSELIQNERSLYKSNRLQLVSQIQVLQEQLEQRKSELEAAKSKYKYLQKSYNLLQKEIEMSVPLAERGVISQVEMLKLRRDSSKELEELASVKLSIPRISSKINEAKSQIDQVKFEFQTKAKKELNDVHNEIARLSTSQTHLKDQVSRTDVTSPVDGTVNQLFVNTVGGVVKPGMDLMEIVPSKDMLLIEVKIKPKDIAFLFPGQKAIVKFSAYDFAIYGGLTGEVSTISADTITDEKGENFYQVRIKTNETALSTAQTRLEIITGMTASVDILTGKKSVMDYLLKPIFKAKSRALSER